MFSVAVFSFSESDGQGFVEIVADMAPSQSFDFVVTGSKYNYIADIVFNV